METALPERITSELEFFVRYAETDAMGVVHHASYVVYLEEARSHYARERGHSYAEFEASGFYLVVSDLQVRYAAPARYGDSLRAQCWIEELKSRQITFGYAIYRQSDGVLCVSAQTRHLCVDKQGQLARIPVQWRTWLG
ncbi:MAG: acyl-CoA thioesterase [Anaerolineae bacterium]|nr:acyl-CoA thioesterase [Anaerolineae bacterium]